MKSYTTVLQTNLLVFLKTWKYAIVHNLSGNQHMKDKYREQWERLGNKDPYWAVLTDPEKKGNKWSSEKFFQAGEAELSIAFLILKRLEIPITYDLAVDFGCGVGRLTRALSFRFDKVIGVDISSSMLNEARRANKHIENIDFVHNTPDNLTIFADNSVDFLYCNIVLQHMPKRKQLVFIKEFCRILRPAGSLVFQTPSSTNLRTFEGWIHLLAGNTIMNFARRIKYGLNHVMEIHTLGGNEAKKILYQQGMDILHIRRHDSAGPALKSYMYFTRKGSVDPCLTSHKETEV